MVAEVSNGTNRCRGTGSEHLNNLRIVTDVGISEVKSYSVFLESANEILHVYGSLDDGKFVPLQNVRKNRIAVANLPCVQDQERPVV